MDPFLAVTGTQFSIGLGVLVAAVFVMAWWRGRDGYERVAPEGNKIQKQKSPTPGSEGSSVAEGANQADSKNSAQAPAARSIATPQGAVLIRLKGVARDYSTPDGGTITALHEVDLEIKRGETLGIIGPSGLGKSTLLNILAGIDFPTRGRVWFDGSDLPAQECSAMRRHRAQAISLIFQDLNLVTHLRAEDNAALPLICRGTKRAIALDRARGHLRSLGLEGLERRLPNQLSGGQKQRVAIARAFASGAPLILADEPTGSLDPVTAREVMDAFSELSHKEKSTVVLVTHDPELARIYCDRVVRLGIDGLHEIQLQAPGVAQ